MGCVVCRCSFCRLFGQLIKKFKNYLVRFLLLLFRGRQIMSMGDAYKEEVVEKNSRLIEMGVLNSVA